MLFNGQIFHVQAQLLIPNENQRFCILLYSNCKQLFLGNCSQRNFIAQPITDHHILHPSIYISLFYRIIIYKFIIIYMYNWWSKLFFTYINFFHHKWCKFEVTIQDDIGSATVMILDKIEEELLSLTTTEIYDISCTKVKYYLQNNTR